MNKLSYRVPVIGLLLWQVACIGNGSGLTGDVKNPNDVNVLNPGGSGSTTSGNAIPNDHIPPVNPCTSNQPAPRGLRRLTLTELNNTLVDIFNDPNVPMSASLFSGDPATYGFHDFQTDMEVRDSGALQVLNMAEAVASYAGGRVNTLVGCTTNDANCQSAILNSLGARIFRQPLTAAQVTAYQGIMSSMPDFSSALQAMISAMLQSPYFLYRTELGTQNGSTFTLTQYELASELSYLVVGSMPDATLMQAAASNALSTPQQIAAQATRLMQDARVHNNVDEFMAEWLQVSELPLASRMEGTDSLADPIKSDMLNETKSLVDNIVFNQNGTFSLLHTVNYTYANQELAGYYGLNGGGFAQQFQQVSLGNRVSGVLGLGGVLSEASQANYASPTLRGRMVRMRMLCQSIPKPPAGVPPLDNGTANETIRQRFEAHESSPTCAACHTLMDPIGFSMGDFDTLGRARANNQENGQTVDTSGAINGLLNGSTVPLTNLSDLAKALQSNTQAADCLSRHWAMYGYGQLTYAQDGCTYDAVAADAAAHSYNLQQMFLALTRVASFTTRVQDP